MILEKRWVFSIIVLVLVVVIAWFVCVIRDVGKPLAFSRNAWISDFPPNSRYRMALSMFKYGTLRGKSRAEVKELLAFTGGKDREGIGPFGAKTTDLTFFVDPLGPTFLYRWTFRVMFLNDKVYRVALEGDTMELSPAYF